MPPGVKALWDSYGRIVRFVISGGTAAAVHFGILFVLVHFFAWYPVTASVTAFFFAFFVSFTLQKLWTYRNHDKKAAGIQMAWYLGIQLINLGLNALFMYLLIEHVAAHYLVAQFVTTGAIAVASFFLYKHVVFHGRSETRSDSATPAV